MEDPNYSDEEDMEIETDDEKNIEYIKKFFQMLRDCEGKHYDLINNIITEVKKYYSDIDCLQEECIQHCLQEECIQHILDLRSDVELTQDVEILRKFRLEEFYDMIKKIEESNRQYAELIRHETEDARRQTIVFDPSIDNVNNKYPAFNTYDFKSARIPTTFGRNFEKLETEKSVVLFIAMHGELILDDNKNPIPMQDRDILLNKFSMASPGQCAFSSPLSRKYVLYAICDALKTGKELDMLTIIREAAAHVYAITNHVDGEAAYNQTIPAIENQRNSGLKEQQTTNSRTTRLSLYDEILAPGGETTEGTKYFNKRYGVGDNKHGIFICTPWPEIEAEIMDNLLENPFFIQWMRDREGATPNKRKRFILPSTTVDIIDRVDFNSVKEFCKAQGRPNMSVADESCSGITISNSKYQITSRGSTILSTALKKRYYDGVAKGIKRKSKRKDNNKSKSKKKGRKGIKSKSKSKRQVILHRFNKSIP